MLPLVHNTIVRNRSNTMPSSPNRSINSLLMFSPQTSSSDASTSHSTQQYGRLNSKENDSECKKLKASKVCISSNRVFQKRSLTLSSLFSPKSSRSASTNSLNQSMVDETIASVLRKRPLCELSNELLNESNKTVSEQNLNQATSSYFRDTNSNLCKSNSVTSTSTDENVLDNLINSSNDLNSFNSNSNSVCDLNTPNQSIPSFPPPPYTQINQIDRLKRCRPFLFRSQSAPQHRSPTTSLDQLHSNNSHILENIEEITDSTDINNRVLSELVEEENEEQMTSKRNSLIDHQFICRLAHEKETKPISGFNTRKELYEKISEAFNIEINQILYCTLNTHKVDMDRLFELQIDLKDTIYVHVRGQTKEIEIEKTDPLIGLTICDNSNGLCLIKKIKDGSIIQKIKFINVGDIIERINNTNLIGYRHIDVANMLKAIPVGELFVIRLVEPKRRDTEELNLSKQLKNKIKKGYSTLRIRSMGPPIFEEEDEITEDVMESFKKINTIIEEFLGISDSELVQQIFDLGKGCRTIEEFYSAIHASDLRVFDFCEETRQEIWNIIEESRHRSS